MEKKTPVLLVTGFDPFQEFDRNPSADIAKAVSGKVARGIKIEGLALPVSWTDAWRIVREATKTLRPIAWLGFGLAPDPFFRLETTARNEAHHYHDAFGQLPPQNGSGEVAPGKTPTIASTLPLSWLREQLLIRNFATLGNYPFEVRYSDDAGGYICNHVFYLAMSELSKKIPTQGFIHVPPYSKDFTSNSPTDKDIVGTGVFIVESMATWLSERPLEA